MPKWTDEQKEAIYKEGTNIIVSAGAGSGKTAVLTERVLEKVKNNENKLFLLHSIYKMQDRLRLSLPGNKI